MAAGIRYSYLMDLLDELLTLTSAAGLGLLMGALLAEGALFVPYWRTLPAPAFFALHKEWGPRLYRFFAPLTIASTMSAMAAAVVGILAERPGRRATLVAGVLAGTMVAIYGAYFKNANVRLAAGRLSSAELASELARWARWQWARVVVGIVAFVASLLGLHGPS